MKKVLLLSAIIALVSQYCLWAQSNEDECQINKLIKKADRVQLIKFYSDNLLQMKKNKEDAIRYMESKGYVIKASYPDGSGIEFMGFRNGLPIYKATRGK